MAIDSLPPEILDLVLGLIDDVYEFMRLSQACKRLQAAVKSRVLVIGDSEIQSPLFKSISGSFIYIGDSSRADNYASDVIKFGLYIVEFSKKYGVEKCFPDTLISNLILHNIQDKKIVRVLLTHDSIESLYYYTPRVSRMATLRMIEYAEDWMTHVSKTICYLPECDHEFFKENQLEIIGHDYEFINIVNLPRIYFHVNEKYDFRVRSKETTTLNGISNTSMGKPRLPPLLKFLELSELPNLTSIHDVSIEAGLSLKIFERFMNLKVLSLQSAFTGNIQLQKFQAPEEATLVNLEVLRITGNAISLFWLKLPKLKDLKIELYGSNERSISQSLYFDSVETPQLDQLFLEIGPLPGALDYITGQLEESIPRLSKLSIIGDIGSFVATFKRLRFDNLVTLTLKTNNFAISDLTHVLEPDLYQDSSHQIDSKYLKFPNLQTLDILDFDKFNTSFINPRIQFPKLQKLLVRFRVLHDPQHYEFKPENFPVITHLTIKYGNRYGPLKECDITVKIGPLKLLKSICYDPNIPLELDQDLRGCILHVNE